METTHHFCFKFVLPMWTPAGSCNTLGAGNTLQFEAS